MGRETASGTVKKKVEIEEDQQVGLSVRDECSEVSHEFHEFVEAGTYVLIKVHEEDDDE